MNREPLAGLLRLIAHADVFRCLQLSEADVFSLRLVCTDLDAAILACTLFWRCLVPECRDAIDVIELCKRRFMHKRLVDILHDGERIVQHHMQFAPMIQSTQRDIIATRERLRNLERIKKRYEDAARISQDECAAIEGRMARARRELAYLHERHCESTCGNTRLDSNLPAGMWKRHKP